jgi:methyl-accepting chemotaxis protein
MTPKLLAGTIAAFALLAAGCGGGEESATEWADSFCTATSEWGEELETIRDGVSGLSVATEDLQAAATATREATDEYVSRLDDLGTPDTGSADEIGAALDELAAEVDGESAEVEDAVDDMTGVAAVVTATREVRASLEASFTALERALSDLRQAETSGELGEGFDAAPSCVRIA